jgi:hypothetical protein
VRDSNVNIANEAQMATFLVKMKFSSPFEAGYKALARPNNVEDRPVFGCSIASSFVPKAWLE